MHFWAAHVQNTTLLTATWSCSGAWAHVQHRNALRRAPNFSFTQLAAVVSRDVRERCGATSFRGILFEPGSTLPADFLQKKIGEGRG